MPYNPMDDLKPLIEEAGLNWSLSPGKSHRKLFVEGQMVVVLPQKGNASEGDRRGRLNNIADVRRAIARIKAQKAGIIIPDARRAQHAGGLILPGTARR